MKQDFKFFESECGPKSLHIGLRMIKTVLAVAICGIIGWLRGSTTMFYSMIAAVLCLQNSKQKTILFSLNRLLGTLIGGFYGVVLLYLAKWIGFFDIEPLYYIIASLFVIPVMFTSLLVRKPSIAAFSCVVLFSVTIAHSLDESPLLFALGRVFDTTIGIVAATVIDLIVPYRKNKKKSIEEPDKEEKCGEKEIL